MGRFTRVLFIIVALLALLSPAHAASKVSMFGAPNSSGTGPMEVDSDRLITVADDATLYNSGAAKDNVEVATTSDTLTAAECGKTIIYDPASTQSTFILPLATAGCSFKFIQADGNASALQKMIIDPNIADTLVGCVASTAATTFAAGDSLISTTSTGDTIKVTGGTNVWYCSDRTGTFVDNN